MIIKQSLNLAKKRANESNSGVKFVIINTTESEDINYSIDWIQVTIQGTKEQEDEEYNETMGMYQPFGKLMKKDMKVDERLNKFFKTKVLSQEQLDDAYKKGYGAVSDNNISNKLLEMGILTHIERFDDFDSR